MSGGPIFRHIPQGRDAQDFGFTRPWSMQKAAAAAANDSIHLTQPRFQKELSHITQEGSARA